MATTWRRCIRRMRFQPSSTNVFSRNRSLVYVISIFPLCLFVLLIPGGEIANFKYTYTEDVDSGAKLFISSFPSSSSSSSSKRRQEDGSDGVVREVRSVGQDSDKPKLVVLYNAFYESRSWRVHGDAFQDCPVSQCELTVDRGRLTEADAVIFNAKGLPDPDELPEHPAWQVWILHNSEPPYNIHLNLKSYNNVFNWTSWYRRDADIFSPYGGYAYKNSNATDNEDSDNGEGDSSEKEQASTEATPSGADTDVYGRHDKVIFFASSNCQDRGRRYKKVAVLKKYLPIDEFGDCGTIHCPKFSEECDKQFSRYQFVLAFENGYCRDYVTEKLWNAYRRMQIPIVGGGANYEKLAIPGSYIDYDNFTSPEELARFIHRVSTSPTVYNSFFQWRERYDVIHAPVADWCGICEALNDQGRQPQVYKDLEGWVAQDSCPLYTKYQKFWTEVYLGIFKVFGV